MRELKTIEKMQTIRDKLLEKAHMSCDRLAELHAEYGASKGEEKILKEFDTLLEGRPSQVKILDCIEKTHAIMTSIYRHNDQETRI